MKTATTLPSSRRFAVAFIEGESISTFWPSISELLADDNSEWKYAIQEQFDEILDMRVGDFRPMRFLRDNTSDGFGYIKRIK